MAFCTSRPWDRNCTSLIVGGARYAADIAIFLQKTDPQMPRVIKSRRGPNSAPVQGASTSLYLSRNIRAQKERIKS